MTTTTSRSTMPTPEAYKPQGERALERATHYIEESVRVNLMRDWDGIDRWVGVGDSRDLATLG
ncbi:hypothetical protein ACFTWF_23750 [Rhodococcus sp. NPDC056960]|uniref:hypothetical protein n=1 Tax=Rhodococcus sp. NPDC056960 TaxID=3345982 RepID=UPI00362FB4D5